MEFRAPTSAAQENAETISYLTKNLSDPEAARERVDGYLSIWVMPFDPTRRGTQSGPLLMRQPMYA